MLRTLLSATAAASCLYAPMSFAQTARNDEGITPKDVAAVIKPEFSPYAGRNFPTRPLFGDTHLHTAVSVDAGTLNRIGQEDAYRFARGEEVLTTHGLRAKLSRPLDFLVIADHAEMYGLMPQLLSGDPEVLATDTGKRWYGALTSGDFDTIFATAMEIVGSLSGDVPPIKSDNGRPERLAGLYGAGGPLQRSGRLHGDDRLRVDGDRRLQPAPQRPVPGRRQRCEPDAAVLAVRQQEPRGPVVLHGRIRSSARARTFSPFRTTATSATAACSRSRASTASR